MRDNGAQPIAHEETGLAETGTNDNTAAIAGMAVALIAAGGGTALAVRRRRTRRTT